MTPRERIETALAHQEPDRVPLDLGATPMTGMHVNTVYALRQVLGLDEPDTPVKVIEPYQMLGEIGLDLLDRLGVDAVGLSPRANLFGFANEGWKPWTTFQGVPVLVPGAFNTELEPDGSLVQYPEGDRAAAPSGRMPRDGWYFDCIVRQAPFDDAQLDPQDNANDVQPVSDVDLAHFRGEAARLHSETGRAVVGNFGGTGFGDIALVPGPWVKDPRGIRGIEEWYMSTLTRPDYVYGVFERQCAVALENLARVHEAVGAKVSVILVTGTDFGTQTGAFVSPDTYCALYQPFHRVVNDWVHRHTPWKTFIHSCGSVRALIPHFIDAGFDILNPVQCSATGMDPGELKAEFGRDLVFWGGGVDTQHTLPFADADAVRAEVRARIRTFAPGGGFVFNPIHNVQAGTPVENLLAMYDVVREEGGYA